MSGNGATSNKIPRPFCLDGNIYHSWLKFKEEFKDYLVSMNFDVKSDEVKAAELRNLIGEEGRLIMANLSFKQSSGYEDMITKLDHWAESHRNITKLRSQFFDRKQDKNENFETFLKDVQFLIQLCNFGDLTEGLLRDKIVTGISNPQLQEFFDTVPDVPLKEAVQMCHTIDLSDDHLSTLLTLKRGGKLNLELDNTNRVEASLMVDGSRLQGDKVADNIDPASTGSQSSKSAVKECIPIFHIRTEGNNVSVSTNVNAADSSQSHTQKVKDDVNSVFLRRISIITNKETFAKTFSCKFQDISKLKNKELSPPHNFGNFSWRILIMQAAYKGQECLSFFVQCNSKQKNWRCFATCELKILPQKEGIEAILKRTNHIYCTEEDDWGFRHIIEWNNLLNPDKGFIKDDSITLEVTILQIHP